MRIDPTQSVYHEDPAVKTSGEFDKQELKHCRQLLRRLRFLEVNVRRSGGIGGGNGSGGAAFAEYEMDALEWALTELGFLAEVLDTPVTASR